MSSTSNYEVNAKVFCFLLVGPCFTHEMSAANFENLPKT